MRATIACTAWWPSKSCRRMSPATLAAARDSNKKRVHLVRKPEQPDTSPMLKECAFDAAYPEVDGAFEAPVEAKINAALKSGNRGLPDGNSLSGLLRRRVGDTGLTHKPVVTQEQIILWARDQGIAELQSIAHHETVARRTGGDRRDRATTSRAR